MMTQERPVATAGENHRVRVAREKRERMHAHLLRSVMAVCSGDQSEGPKVIDDVVRHAEVSRGTFYKHFGSLEQAVAELGAELAEEMTVGIAPIYDVIEDPRERTATGFQLFTRRAMFDPHWGGFVAHVGLLEPSNAMIRHMADDIGRGIAAGLYDLAGVECGLDLLVGTKIEAIRRIVRGGRDVAYVEKMSALILRGFGLAPAEAGRIAAATSKRLDAVAPGTLDWWLGRDNERERA
jgi:AcrR family transcriptional regulator